MSLTELIIGGLIPLPLKILLCLFISMIVGFKLINSLLVYFSQSKTIQDVREDTPKTHQLKNGIPSMGGVSIVFGTLSSYLLLGHYHDLEMLSVLTCFMLFALIGGYYDWFKWVSKEGITARLKFSLQLFSSALFVFYFYVCGHDGVLIPGINCVWYLGYLMIPWSMFVVVGSSNAYNLTDGLDGLAISIGILIMFSIGAYAFLAPSLDIKLLDSIQPLYRENVLIVLSSVIGSSLSFYWFNAHPAKIFMGDVGSLSLGALFACLSISIHMELFFAIASLVIICETLSVIIQVFSFKFRKKRIFLMSPIHHHFELLGWKETSITARFWIVALISSLVSITLLVL